VPEMQEAANIFVELWAESKETPRVFERRMKDKIKEIETFFTTDCLRVIFLRLVFSFCLIFLVL
jgi:hypothetical protein